MFVILAIKNYHDTKSELNIASDRLDFINKKKQELEKEILENKIVIKRIEDNLKYLKGIEYKLYYEIVVNNLNVTKAIDKIALKEDKDVSTIWKNYYPKIKEEIKKVKNL